MTNHNERTSTTIILHGEDKAIVSQFCKDSGLSTSAGIRLIIREWAQFKRNQLVDTRPAYVAEAFR